MEAGRKCSVAAVQSESYQASTQSRNAHDTHCTLPRGYYTAPEPDRPGLVEVAHIGSNLSLLSFSWTSATKDITRVFYERQERTEQAFLFIVCRQDIN